MFTGIVEEVGVIKQVDRPPGTGCLRLRILAKVVLEDLERGESLTVNGVCLTVVEIGETDFTVDVSGQTQSLTNLSSLKVGDAVNLERAMRLNDRLGGHLVSGHVDGIGRIQDRRAAGETFYLTIGAPPNVIRYCIQKGSITVDGISLTIVDFTDKDFTISVIPHTAKATTLGLKGIGDAVNLEGDLLAKYIERFLRGDEARSTGGRIGIDYLTRHDLL